MNKLTVLTAAAVFMTAVAGSSAETSKTAKPGGKAPEVKKKVTAAKPVAPAAKAVPGKKKQVEEIVVVPVVVEEAVVIIDEKETKYWEFFQFGVWLGGPPATSIIDCYGIKVGAPFSSGGASVIGLEASVFYSGTRKVSGVQCALIAERCEELTGLQFSIVNIAKKAMGLQLGVLNFSEDSTVQLGILNFNENGFLPIFPFVNFSVK